MQKVEPNLLVRNVEVSSKNVEVLSTVSPNLTKLVEQLTQQPRFLSNVEEAVKKILANGMLDFADVPTIVHLIVDSIENIKVTKEDLTNFVKLVFQFIVKKYKLLSDDKVSEYEKILVSSVKLVLLIPNLSEENIVACTPSIFSLCIPKNKK